MTKYLVSAGVVTEPWLSSHGFDLALIGLILGVFGAVALYAAAEQLIKAYRRNASADIGDRLLEACSGDLTTVELVIASAEISNDVLDAEMAAGLRSAYRTRQAEFNTACQEDCECYGGHRWQEVS